MTREQITPKPPILQNVLHYRNDMVRNPHTAAIDDDLFISTRLLMSLRRKHRRDTYKYGK